MSVFVNKELAFKLESTIALNRIEFADTQNKISGNPSSVHVKIGGGYAIFAGSDSPLTRSNGLGFTGPVDGGQIIELEKFFGEKESSVKVEVSQLADMSLTHLLIRRGYSIADYTTVLVKAFHESEKHKSSSKNLVHVVGEDEVDVFAKTVTKSFLGKNETSHKTEYDAHSIQKSFQKVSEIFFFQPHAKCFICCRNDIPVGGGGLFFYKEMALFIGTSTLPQYRNMGIQTELLKSRINHAVANGSSLGISVTFPGSISQHNLQKLGFQIAYGRITFIKEHKRKVRAPTGRYQ